MDVYQRRRLVALSIVAVLFIVLVLVIRSCGNDEEAAPIAPVAGATGTGGATVLTLGAYIDQADATCLESNSALAEVDQADPVTAATEQGQIIAGQLESLQTLPVPEDGANRLESYFAALQDQIEAYDRLITALERGDTAAAAEIQTRIDEAAAEAQDAAAKVGLDVCGDASQVSESSGSADEGSVPTDPDVPADTGTVPVTPPPVTTTTPAPPPTDGGVAPPAPAPAPPATDGDSGSGGVSP